VPKHPDFKTVRTNPILLKEDGFVGESTPFSMILKKRFLED